MRSTPELSPPKALAKLTTYPYAVLTWVEPTGYPVSVAVETDVDPLAGTVRFERPAGLTVPMDRDVSLTGSHIRPQPGYGYDERRHVTVWGHAQPADGDRLAVSPSSAWGWDEAEVPFFEYSERSVGKARRYFDALSRERGTPIKPRLSLPFLVLRTTRLPFLSATIVPVVLGIVIAASHGFFDILTAVLTIIGACLVQLAINVSNDVFDTAQGADDANVTPTKFSGGSRVIQYGLVSFRGMATLAASLYVAGALVGLLLLVLRGSPALLAIGLAGLVVGLGYTAPPLKLVYRGLGEIAVAVGFGPIMLLGAYVVQTGELAWEPFVLSLVPGILIALILYVNEIPDRRSDAEAGKRTLPVRLAPSAVRAGYLAGAVAAFAIIVAGVVGGLFPWPTLVALAAVPIALRVHAGLKVHYDSPYTLMAVMGTNVNLNLVVGGLLLAAYVAWIAAGLLPG
jgi:1,4-dihydroxy-2-naphthoate octaprenyltransferase